MKLQYNPITRCYAPRTGPSRLHAQAVAAQAVPAQASSRQPGVVFLVDISVGSLEAQRFPERRLDEDDLEGFVGPWMLLLHVALALGLAAAESQRRPG